MASANRASDSLLGKPTQYVETYTPALLFPIPRRSKREELGVLDSALPFVGEDVWQGYEISWLNPKGKPCVALGRFCFPAETPNLIESKSFKLYLNSFNQSVFADIEAVRQCMQSDLSAAAGGHVQLALTSLSAQSSRTIEALPGECLDDLDLDGFVYDSPTPSLLSLTQAIEPVCETLHSHLLKSNCLVTGQPDWASVVIEYEGRAMDRAGLLRYLVSFRQHNEFHEQCVERIYCDILAQCAPTKLSVWARYTRRGGLDINPWRSTRTDFGRPPKAAGDVRQ